MTAAEQLRVDGVVRRGLGVHPWETVKEAAQRVLRRPGQRHGVRMAAHVVLEEPRPPVDAWEAFVRAAWWLEVAS